MAKYYVDWESIDKEDAPVLIEAAARYMSTDDCYVDNTIASILGIKKAEEE